jgi:hypothetical protein
LLEEGLVDGGSGRSKGGCSNEFLEKMSVFCQIEGILRLTKVGLPTSFRASHKKGFSKL